MGNCQAVDAAALVIQHPSGKIERFYWSVRASEVMKVNPGHYVSLIMPLPKQEHNDTNQEEKAGLFTRVRLLKPDEILTLGHAYRLITTQEVTKVMKAKKRKSQGKTVEALQMVHLEEESSACETGGMLDTGKIYQELPEDQRADAVSSMVYEAGARIRDPVYGCAGAICHLQKQVSELQAQLAKSQADLINMQLQQANLVALICMEMQGETPKEEESPQLSCKFVYHL